MKPQDFKVDTRPTKQVVVNSLTRDFTTDATILDLVDNAVDAARDAIFARPGQDAAQGLPTSYAGFEIEIDCDAKRLLIADNCGGMSREDLASTVLRFGQRSNHALGIGIFGVGLNRAIFKLGTTTLLTTDTGTRRCTLELDVPHYLADEDWQLPAVESESAGVAGTSIEVSGLHAEITADLGNAAWIDQLKEQIATKYSLFLRKGLAIRVNGEAIQPKLPEIRSGGPVSEQKKILNASSAVLVDLRVGQHAQHRFTSEADYIRASQSVIASDFGWTVICNDRVLLVGDKSPKTGWESFHTEFNGFLGIAAFEARDPSMLPWNTAKTDVDLNNAAYQSALSSMKSYVTNWRKAADKRKRANGGSPTPVSSAKGNVSGADASSPRDGQAQPLAGRAGLKGPTSPAAKPDHRQYSTVLPQDIDESHCKDKLLAVVHEAQKTDLADQTYAGMALVRILVEIGAVHHLRRNNLADALKSHVVDAREKSWARLLTDEEKRQVHPTFDDLVAFLQSDRMNFGATRKTLKTSLAAIKKHQGILNGVMHNPDQLVTPDTALAIRDEVTPVLRHLIET